MEEVYIVAMVLGAPTALLALFMRQRHAEKMKLLDRQANGGRLAALEQARGELEGRVRTLETVITASDQEMEQRLRRLGSAVNGLGEPSSLPSAVRSAGGAT